MSVKTSKKIYNYLTCGDCLKDLEKLLAFITVAGVIVFGLITLYQLTQISWLELSSYRFMLERILELAIGVELARLLLSYNLETVVELLAFVVARKVVLLENDFVSLLLGILALTILFAAKGVLTYVEGKQETVRQSKITNGIKNQE